MEKITLDKGFVGCLDKGFVGLIDCFPDKNLELAIVDAARVSTSQIPQVRTDKENKALIRYLYRNKHTSPFEMVVFKFAIKAPLEVFSHFVRHRTASINAFSGRYAEFNDEYYNPLAVENGIRFQDEFNKQGSVVGEVTPEIRAKFEKINEHIDEIYKLYHSLIKENNVSKECARYCLTNSSYTVFFFQMNLHNLLHFFELRADLHTQLETQLYAKAMMELIADKVPTVMECFKTFTLNSIHLSEDEVDAIFSQKFRLTRPRENQELQDKLNRLFMQTAPCPFPNE